MEIHLCNWQIDKIGALLYFVLFYEWGKTNLTFSVNYHLWITSHSFFSLIRLVSHSLKIGSWEDQSGIGVLQRWWSFDVYSTPWKSARSYCKALHAAARFALDFASASHFSLPVLHIHWVIHVLMLKWLCYLQWQVCKCFVTIILYIGI